MPSRLEVPHRSQESHQALSDKAETVAPGTSTFRPPSRHDAEPLVDAAPEKGGLNIIRGNHKIQKVPAPLLEEIRNHHTLVPRTNKESALSRALQAAAEEKAKLASSDTKKVSTCGNFSMTIRTSWLVPSKFSQAKSGKEADLETSASVDPSTRLCTDTC